ncbi:hypothetical protein [Shewanella gelidii]|uniref:Uncharacterized protein n=1 Tax=Shewanella gelidii TaxID=1642821 RepID=A0A917JLP8_9GAMM|nr:hypothetical protein [Shewanella gelidii]MCL1097012.1 hypothetical protein [Shewanella gelidii]GGI71916.1 hypothetical protein GCM10009332_06600 [Shewanella gelidii]
MFEELMNHKEWIFSGLGIVVVGGLITIIKKVKFSSLRKRASSLYGVLASVFKSNEDILKNINIDLRPRNEPFELWLHDLPKSQFWLRGVNLNPFDIEIKQISIEFNYGGMSAKCNEFLHDRYLHGLSINDAILVEDDLTGEQADYIAEYEDNPRSKVTIKAVLKTPSKEVLYENRYLEGALPSLVNEQLRKEKMLNKSKHTDADACAGV